MGWFGCYLVLNVIIFSHQFKNYSALHWCSHALSVQLFSLCVTFSNSLNFFEVSQLRNKLPFFFLSSNSSCTKISALKNVQMEEAIFYCGDAVCYKVCNVLNMADAKKLPPITRKKKRKREEDWDIKSCTPMKVYGTILQGKDY